MPYIIADSAKGYLSPAGSETFLFTRALNKVDYFIQVKHRNSIETWSRSGLRFVNSQLNYDFTTDSLRAYGNNLVPVDFQPVRYAIYSGDINQDDVIDASDLSLVYNDSFNSVTGYVNTDVSGDNFVDASDISIVDNNVLRTVILKRP